MDKCQKMEKFINDHTDVAMKFMIWEQSILPMQLNKEDGPADLTDIDFDIID